MPEIVSPGVNEGIFTTWTQVWDKNSTNLSNFGGVSPGTYTYNLNGTIFIDEADSFFLFLNPSGPSPALVVQNLSDGSYSSTSKNLTLNQSPWNVSNTVRSRYLLLLGNPAAIGVTDKFTVLQKGLTLFTSPSVLKAGDSSGGGITILAISVSGKYIGIRFHDDTDGLDHVQLWQGS